MILSLNQPDFIAVNFYVWIVMFRSEFVPRRKHSLVYYEDQLRPVTRSNINVALSCTDVMCELFVLFVSCFNQNHNLFTTFEKKARIKF